MNEDTMYSFLWLCIAAVLISIVAAVGFNYHASLKMEERLITEYGIDPIILSCANGGFKQNGAAAVFCMEALKKYKISERDIAKLRETINQE